jgi:hypothetical protein
MSAQESPTPQVAAQPATPSVVPAVATQGQPSGARLHSATATSGAGSTQPATDPVVTGVTISNGPESLGEAARKQKQHQACLELAKDNPSIVCK